MIYRLVYYSKIWGKSLTPDDIDELLAKSRQNNVSVGITGALMFDEGYFAQVLEGPQDAVEETFERIQMDPRHRDVQIVEFAPVPERTFDQWAMAYAGSRPAAETRAMSVEAAFDPTKLAGQELFQRVAKLIFLDEGPHKLQIAP